MPNFRNNTNTTSYRGPGFLGFLALIFITLKLTGYIAWSWWWVLAPIWIPVSVALLLLVGLLIFYKDKL